MFILLTNLSLGKALKQKGIETYKDDEKIKKGTTIDGQLIKSIEDSRFYIIVFSKNYASSSWCLNELVKITECKKTTEQIVYPIFFDVEPTEVRKQSGAVKEAAKHEKEEAAGTWIKAMKEASNLAGWELKATANGDESKLIQIIVDVIFKKKYSILSNADGKLVGMETRISDVLSSLNVGTEDVRMIGIKGMGGGGKTTLARAVYDQISNHFEGTSFVENVREVSKHTLSGLKKLQKKILKDVLNKQDITFSSVHDGKNMLKDMMSRKKTLVVLDDVDCIEQLEALSGELNWFKSGSRIIITTRDEQLLSAHGVNEFVHDVNLLSPTEAICLFSRYAFKREIPNQGYEELSGQVVQYAHGLPLTIKVLGSFLCGQSEPYWLDAIERLKTIPLKATMERLEISFDCLEDDCKEIFLDIACIIKGWGKEDAIRVLESRGFRAIYGLRVLEQKSLRTISSDEFGELGMHDHLEEMGRNIVRRLHPDEPKKHSRLWSDKEIEYILTNNLGTQATKCLHLWSPVLIAIKGLAKMKDLRFIHIDMKLWEMDKVSEYLPSSLQFMSWSGFPFSSLPNTFQGKYLVELEMHNINIVQLWEDGEEKVLNNLRFLTICCSKLRTFDLRLAPNLEKLIIFECYNFVELHIPADHHLKLKYLWMIDSKLTNLHLGNTPNLKKLKLKHCHELVEFQMPAESLKLKHLDLSLSKLTNLHLGNTPNLNMLELKDCHDLVEFQMPTESLKLEHLDLTDSKLTTLHLKNTPNLKKLKLSHSKLKTLHLGTTPNLKKLILEGCNDLVELKMPDESPNIQYLDLTHSKLKTLHLGTTPNLETLILEGCNDLVDLQMPEKSLKLEHLDLSHSAMTNLHLGNTPKLKMLKLEGCKDLVEFQMPKLEYLDLSNSKFINLYLENTPNLKNLTLQGCNDFLKLQIPAESMTFTVLDLSYSKLTNLHLENTLNIKKLKLKGCNDLVELQMSAESLKLEHLNLSHSKLKSLRLGNTQNLEKLKLKGCDDLVEFQMPAEILKLKHLDISYSKLTNLHLRSTPNLEKLILCGCNDLEDPDSSFVNLETLISIGLCTCTNLESFSRSICGLQCLGKLTLERQYSRSTQGPRPIVSCWLLEKLPEDLGRLQCLEKLILTDCKVLQGLPNKMKNLISLHLDECRLIMKLPEEIGRLECLKELDLTRSGISCLPTGIFQLKGLRIVREDKQLRSFGFTSEIQISENEAITGTESSSLVQRAQRRKRLNWEILMEASCDSRIMFSPLLDLLVAKIKQNIWAVYFCIPEMDIDSGGLKIIERDADVHALYDLAKTHKKVNLYVAHSPQNLAPYYHNNLCLDSSDSEVTLKKRQHDQWKKDAGNMSYDQLVAWAEEEAQSPYLRSPPPHKERPLRKDFEGKVTFTRVWTPDDDFTNDVPFLTEDEVYKSPDKVADNVGVESVTDDVVDVGSMPPSNDVVDGVVENMHTVADEVDGNHDTNVDIDEVVLSRQKKLDKGKGVMPQKDNSSSKKKNKVCRPTGITIRENANPVSSSDSDIETKMYQSNEELSDYEFYESDNQSDKSYDYLSDCDDEVIQLRKRISQRKDTTADDQDQQQGSENEDDDTPEVVDYYTTSGLANLVREHERYMESLLKQIKGNGVGVSDPFSVDLNSKSKDKYPVHDEDTHWRLKKPKHYMLKSFLIRMHLQLGEKYATVDAFKDCCTHYALEIVMEASSNSRIMFSPLLDLLVAKIKQNIWAVYFCIPDLDIDSGVMEILLDVVFKIHYNGVFMFDPLRYEYGREIVMEASSNSRIMFSPLLDLLVAKIKQNIWAVYFCIPDLDIDNGGLKIIERDANVHALYDLAKTHKKVNLYVAHSPQNLAPYYHQNLCLDSSDSEVTSKKKQHDQWKKDAGNMSYDELVAWAEEEAQSPYLRSPPPHKDRPLRKDFEGKVTFTRVLTQDDDFTHDVPFLTEDEVYKSPEKVAENVGVDSVTDDVVDVGNTPPSNEVADVVVENRPTVADDVEGIPDTNVDIDEPNDEYSEYESYESGNESDKPYDYLSDCEDEVIELRKRVSQRKQRIPDDQEQEQGSDEQDDETPEVIDYYTSPGLASLVREHESYMESLLKHIKGNGVGISDPFSVDLNSKSNDKYPVHDEDTHWRLKKPKG
ncbi:toll/interleukin-1 receptor (TIR) domain-containing protein [Artemisia annua]|uniref:Toll/interleukin-1 receptor (TIR) domain-containing protein n=1 Tax=Artemisia annua TaxID=35608 RepID=A0A2U1MYT1_ARTAN|nr:toll/interleukin-1 receptor (TIR) domain-containing protein [Artemisia annua]